MRLLSLAAGAGQILRSYTGRAKKKWSSGPQRRLSSPDSHRRISQGSPGALAPGTRLRSRSPPAGAMGRAAQAGSGPPGVGLATPVRPARPR